MEKSQFHDGSISTITIQAKLTTLTTSQFQDGSISTNKIVVNVAWENNLNSRMVRLVPEEIIDNGWDK